MVVDIYTDLMHAQAEREAGYQGRSGDEVLADMRQIIAEAKSTANKDNPVTKGVNHRISPIGDVPITYFYGRTVMKLDRAPVF